MDFAGSVDTVDKQTRAVDHSYQYFVLLLSRRDVSDSNRRTKLLRRSSVVDRHVVATTIDSCSSDNGHRRGHGLLQGTSLPGYTRAEGTTVHRDAAAVQMG